MGFSRLQARFARIFTQRCFYLFVALIALIVVAPFVIDTLRGRLVLHAAQFLVLAAAVAAVGRTSMPFVIALLLGLSGLGFQVMNDLGVGNVAGDLTNATIATGFVVAFYIVAVSYLLAYVFNPEVMSEDKLFGAAAAYLMLGILWADAYLLVQHFEPQAFGARPGEAPKPFYDLLFASFGYLSSNGPGDIMPMGAKARALAILEQITGVLYVAILIARLAGIYPPSPKKGES
jgi:hypothetical protein